MSLETAASVESDNADFGASAFLSWIFTKMGCGKFVSL